MILKKIKYYLPENVETNKELSRQNPDWEMEKITKRTGVLSRHIAGSKETALDLAVKACRKLFKEEKTLPQKLDAIIFCTQSPDYLMPPNSCLLHKEFRLAEHVMAFDFNHACSGYLYGLGLAKALFDSGQCSHALLVTSDTYSRYINKQDRSARVLFGDAAAVSYLIPSSSPTKGLLDIVYGTSGKNYPLFYIPAGGQKNPPSRQTKIEQRDKSGNRRTQENIHMDGIGVLAFVSSRVPAQINHILKRNKMTVDEVDLFIFHQASKMALEKLAEILKIKPEQVYVNMEKIGNTVSASIPIAIQDALDAKIIKKGFKVILCGFGVGMSWATALYQF